MAIDTSSPLWSWLWNGGNAGGLLPTGSPPTNAGIWASANTADPSSYFAAPTPTPMPVASSAPPSTAAAPSAAAPAPVTAPRFPVLSSLGSSLGSMFAPSAQSASAHPFLSNMQGFFQNNPNAIDALAAGLSSAPNIRSGISAAAGAMPQARQADYTYRGQQAAQQFFNDPKNTAGLSPATLKYIQANPAIAEQFLQTQLIPHPGVAVAQGGALVNPLNGAILYNNNPFAPVSGTGASGGDSSGINVGGAAATGQPAAASPSAGQPAADGTPPAASGTKPGRNESFLNQYSPDTQQVIRDIADYKIPLDSITSRNMNQAQAASLVTQYDPSYNAQNYDAQQAVRTSFANGPYATSVDAANTAVGHLGLLKQISTTLQNGQFPDVNAALNFLKQQTGSDAPTNFANDVNGVVREVSRIYTAAGADDSEVKAWGEGINPNMSPQQFQGAFNTLMSMMSTKLGVLAFRYKSITGDDPNILTPESVSTLKSMGIDPVQVMNGSLQYNVGGSQSSPLVPAAPGAPVEGQTATGPNGQKAILKNGRWVDATTGLPLQ